MDGMPARSLRAVPGLLVFGLLCIGMVLLASPIRCLAQQPRETPLTQLELQSDLMSFADRFHEFLVQASIDPEFHNQSLLFGDHLAILLAAFTIAAGPNPGVGLLDMVVLTTLGRIIYEEHWLKQYGGLVKPYLTALRSLEADIWKIAAKVLTPDEQRELRNLIRAWRQAHPQQVLFAFIRFSDFAGERGTFTVAEAQKARGLFKSVQKATQKIEDVRLLAERGLYLGSRTLLLLGPVGEAWLTEWLRQPELTQLRRDVTQISDAMNRAVELTEQLPTNIRQEREATVADVAKRVTRERQATIQQLMDRVDITLNLLMDRVGDERRQLMHELTSEEAGLIGALTALQQTLAMANTLGTTMQGTVQALDAFAVRSHARLTAADKQTADVNDIRRLVVDVAQTTQHLEGLVQALDRLLVSPGWEQRLPQLLQVLDRVTTEGGDFVTHTLSRSFTYGLALLLVLLLGIVLSGMILIQYAAKRFARG